ncbi:MAG: UDP-N-acetylmuramoyl-tripeptide--D-alanyl-D-alanine ligase [Burkholderiales bacterium]|nr:UDP-N-acetylmuramoyl-tripeptide--D-alanyl-D-alanine ligase [Burkholderiales bacterium]
MMMRTAEAARALDADMRGADVAFDAVSTDSRSVRRGDLFVALRGERFDGHHFVNQAAAAGAAAALVEDVESVTPIREADLPAIVVQDTRRALGQLAAYWRGKFTLPLVALTGSSGKTTVKEMLSGILRANAGDESVLATRGNLNNDIGVSLMLLELRARHRYAVIEMGMNHPGEIGYLSCLAAPDVALINNAGRAHIEYLGSEEAIARAKGEIFEGLAADGTAVINADDRFAPLWRDLAGGRKRIEFGVDSPAAVTACAELRAFDSEIVLETPLGGATLTLPSPGLHNVRNALAASAAAVALEIPAATIGRGLSAFGGVGGRLQQVAAVNGATLIDDTYNANPESVAAAIAALSRMQGRRLLVLGDMGELGDQAADFHAEIGSVAKKMGIDALYTLGKHSALATAAFGTGARHFPGIEELLAEVGNALVPGVTLLVKGSRFMQMERVVHAFRADAKNGVRQEAKA